MASLVDKIILSTDNFQSLSYCTQDGGNLEDRKRNGLVGKGLWEKAGGRTGHRPQASSFTGLYQPPSFWLHLMQVGFSTTEFSLAAGKHPQPVRMCWVQWRSSAEFLFGAMLVVAPPPYSAVFMACKGGLVLYQNLPTHFGAGTSTHCL